MRTLKIVFKNLALTKEAAQLYTSFCSSKINDGLDGAYPVKLIPSVKKNNWENFDGIIELSDISPDDLNASLNGALYKKIIKDDFIQTRDGFQCDPSRLDLEDFPAWLSCQL